MSKKPFWTPNFQETLFVLEVILIKIIFKLLLLKTFNV